MDKLLVMIPFFPLYRFVRSLFRYGLPHRSRVFVLGIWAVKLVVLEPFRLIGEIRWLLSRGETPEDPIIILGYYRSGTTYLQHLMVQDEKMSTLSLFHSILPELISLREIFLPLFKFITDILGSVNAFHRLKFDWTFPGEDDVCINAGVCVRDFNKMFQFPSSINKAIDEFILFKNDRLKEEWIKEHKRLLKRISLKNPGKRIVLKSPPHTGRLRLLKEMYPKAKFIFISRNAKETILSNRLIWELNKPFSFERYSEDDSDVRTMALYTALHRRYLEDRQYLSPDDLVEVSYSNFIQFPKEELRRIYSTLGLAGFEENEKNFTKLIVERKDYKQRTVNGQINLISSVQEIDILLHKA